MFAGAAALHFGAMRAPRTEITLQLRLAVLLSLRIPGLAAFAAVALVVAGLV